MPAKVSVNKRTVVHKNSTGIATAFPDVAKTPAPPAPPVPVPYPNIAMSSDATKTTKKVKCDGQGVMVKGSNISRSSGDEAGTIGGMVSNVNMGKAEFMNHSFDVKFEGKTVSRLGDPMTQNGGTPNAATPAEGQPPQPPAMGEGGDAEACERLKNKQVPPDDVGDVAEECGMAREHAEGIQGVCEATGETVSFRSTNTDCMDHIRNGLQSKGPDVKAKTISDATLGNAPNAGDVPSEVRGLVGSYDDNGAITGVLQSDGSTAALSDIPPIPGDSLTGDYDMHDVFSSSGSRVPPGAGESDTIGRLNEAIGRGDPGPASDMVQHGPQANYPDWVSQQPDMAGNPGLMVPDVGPDDPLLVFDGNGNVYKLESEQELRDLYACKGAETPESWDWTEDDWKKAHQDGVTSEMPSAEFIAQREGVLGGLGI